MAAASLLVRQAAARGVDVAVVQLVDRRQDPPGDAQEWTFQRDVEAVLYGNGYAQTTGAVYRLLQRSGVVRESLALKKACVQQGTVTQDEFDLLRGHLGDVRSFTLIPLVALRTALSVFGCDERSDALVAALGIERPADWPEVHPEEEGEEEEEEQEEEEGGGGNEDEGGNGGEGGDEDEGGDDSQGGGDPVDDVGGSDGVSIADTEVVDEPEVVGHDDDAEEPSPAIHSAKRQHVDLEPIAVTPTLEAELTAFDAYRAALINQSRDGGASATATRNTNRVHILRFFAWLVDQKMLKRDATLTLFGNKYIGTAVERYVKDIVHQHARTWAYAARLLSSFVAAARFVVAQRGGQDPNGSIAKLTALHSQSTQQARIESKFSLAEKPAGFLDWDAVQRVRAAAETALRAAKTDAAKLKGVRDVTVLRLLADQPPDRVGVTRTLQLGSTLKRKDDCSYELDLSQPGAHKTAAVFGATRTTINASITPWLDRYIKLAGIQDGGFLFHAPGDPQAAASPSTWTERVKAIFARHGDVAFCPKDARSSFITFLRSGDHDDEAVKAAAIAMRHSSKTAASAAYDKGASDRRVSAAMKVAADYSAKFTAGASSSTDNQ
jgi:integrase